MTREEYLAELKLKLSSLSQDELNEAMQYYSDYFDEANDDEKVMAELGSPEELSKVIAEISGTANLSPDSAVLMGERQRVCAERALDGVKEAISALECGQTMDAVGVCVDDAIASLLELTGKRVTNEVCDEIFKRFCVGK